MSILSILSIFVFVICLIVGCIKGALQAVLKLVFALITCLMVLLLTPLISNALNDTLQDNGVHPGLVSGICAFIIAVIFLVVFGIINWIINRRVAESVLSRPNRILGALLYAFIGLVFLILLGYVIKIFSNVEFMQPVVENTQKDAFSRWLVSNNLFNSFMEAVAKEGGVFDKFIDGFKQVADQSSDNAEQTASILKGLLGV